MSRRENRKNKREEEQEKPKYVQEATTLADTRNEPRPDEKYGRLIDSYHASRDEIKKTVTTFLFAKRLHDRQSEDELKQKIRELKREYVTLKECLELDKPAELMVHYNESGIKRVDGTVRDWTVANYHLTGKVKNAKGLLLENEKPNPGKKKKENRWASCGSGECYIVGKLKFTLLDSSGAHTYQSRLYEYDNRETVECLASDHKPLIKTKDGRLIYRASLEDMEELHTDGKDAITRMGDLMDNPKYNNKIRITAKRIDRGGV